MSNKIQRFNVYGTSDFSDNGSLVNYEDHKEVVRLIEKEKDAEIERLKEMFGDILCWDSCPLEYKLDIAEIYGWQDELDAILKGDDDA